MTIIFLNPHNGKLYVCAEGDMMRVLEPDDPQLLNMIPNDDILYVRNGNMFTKSQFQDFLQGKANYDLSPQYDPNFDSGFRLDRRPTARYPDRHEEEVDYNYGNRSTRERLYIHPVHNGTIIIGDIKTEKYPHGIELNGKYDFVPIDEIGEEVLNESNHFRVLRAKGKVEIVKHDYVMKNRHRRRNQSPTDAALDAILIQDSRRGSARRYADDYGRVSGGRGYGGRVERNDDMGVYDPGDGGPIEIDVY